MVAGQAKKGRMKKVSREEIEAVGDIFLEGLMILFENMVRKHPEYEPLRPEFEESQRVISEVQGEGFDGAVWSEVERRLPHNRWVKMIVDYRRSGGFEAQIRSETPEARKAVRKDVRELVRKRRAGRHRH